jgi:hypothetical protein
MRLQLRRHRHTEVACLRDRGMEIVRKAAFPVFLQPVIEIETGA